MEDKELWTTFEKTGRIVDYLNYKHLYEGEYKDNYTNGKEQTAGRPLNLMDLRLIIIATKVPRKKFRKVAKKAQIRVQLKTEPNCLPMELVELKRALKLSRPTQSNRTRLLVSLL